MGSAIAVTPILKIMNKQERIDAVAAVTGNSKSCIAEAIDDAIVRTVTGAVGADEAVQLVGFGTFSAEAWAARVGRNPAARAAMQMAAARTLKFAAGKAFRDAVNVG